MPQKRSRNKRRAVERTQTGIRLEKRILKVLKGLAAYHEMTLGDLIEGICLHAFEGKVPFDAKGIKKINEMKKIYALTLTATDSHCLIEEE